MQFNRRLRSSIRCVIRGWVSSTAMFTIYHSTEGEDSTTVAADFFSASISFTEAASVCSGCPASAVSGVCSGELAWVSAAAGVTPSCCASLSFTTGLWMVCASSLAFFRIVGAVGTLHRLRGLTKFIHRGFQFWSQVLEARFFDLLQTVLELLELQLLGQFILNRGRKGSQRAYPARYRFLPLPAIVEAPER
ncbi:Uncharacterised protein [Citrobacter koseri]|uniref:Uncharacterized protein n=1 Tax=Citrobacter koseri TaxID=545 RepID=A0A2X2WT12_CITKO|nr:Uncharacterised protein [Citrobacter koseri]